MNVRKMVTLVSFVVVSALLAGKARAGESDQSIRVTFSGSVQVPGRVLPAGTYWFELVDDRGTQVVQILSANHSASYGFFNTISRERLVANDSAVITLAKRGETEPEAVVAWFYPGHTIGHQFVY